MSPRARHPAEVWVQRAVTGLGLALVAHVAFRLTIELGAKPMLAVILATVAALGIGAFLWRRSRRTDVAA